MTETLTIRLPSVLAEQLKSKAQAEHTNPTEVLRAAAEKYVRDDQTRRRQAAVEHLRAQAGTWDGDISGEELLRRTRP